VDDGIAAGMVKDMVPHDLPVTLGRDFAGVVEPVGDGVTGVSAGDEVFGFVPAMGPTVHAGAWAELIAVPEAGIGRKPDGVDTAAALAAVTAVLCVDALDLSQGDTMPIAGATGGVGNIAVQLAAAAGATVIAPGLPEDEDYRRGLGVTEVLPRDGDVIASLRERRPEGVDAIVKLINHAPGTYDGALTDGGRVSSATNAAGEGPGRSNVIAAPSSEILARIAQHLADGTLEVPVQHTYDFVPAPEAMQALGATHTQGELARRGA
jgi:NADPH:quinone reductase-like Zn-dependent oxidoreductase